MLATVRLVNAVFYAHHGVMQEEHRIGGRYEVDVAMDLDVDAAAGADDLTRTVDYERVYAFVREVVLGNKFYLIERIAYRIAHAVVAHYPAVEHVEVTVRKPNPPVGGPCDYAEATYRATRESVAMREEQSEAGSEREVTVYVGLGANAGERAAALRAAVEALDAAEGVVVEAVSPVYETEPHRLPGQEPQPDHLNAVARLRTAHAPDALLDVFRALEQAAGRPADAPRWGARPLDLDLLLYADLALESPALTLPHPRLAERRFVLQPLADLAPDLAVPGLDATVADLLAACPDPARVEPTDLRLW